MALKNGDNMTPTDMKSITKLLMATKNGKNMIQMAI